MNLREKRIEFTWCLSMLLRWAHEKHIDVALGPDGLKHMAGSLHYVGLAVDLNAYRDGEYLTATEDYRELGESWKALNPDNRWGGDFHNADGNHFSMTHEGKA